MAKDTFWFPHDYNARSDKKMKVLIKNHGVAGYGLYWIVAEMLHEEESSQLVLDELQYEVIADESKLEVNEVKTMLDHFINKYQAFEIDGNVLSSKRVDRNKEHRAATSHMRSINGRKGAAKRWGKDGKNGKPIAIANSKMANDGKGHTIQTIQKGHTQSRLESFKEFWRVYDLDKGEVQCQIEWSELLDEDISQILSTVKDYVKANPDKRWRKNPINYLKNRCWEDEIVIPKDEQQNKNLEAWQRAR